MRFSQAPPTLNETEVSCKVFILNAVIDSVTIRQGLSNVQSAHSGVIDTVQCILCTSKAEFSNVAQVGSQNENRIFCKKLLVLIS